MKKYFAILAFCTLCLFCGLGARTIENKDYPRYAGIAREILELKSWVMLHYNEDLYVDKPPLHFWNIALAYKLFGVTPFAARVPSALFALLLLCGALFFTRRAGMSTDTAILSALILLSSYCFFAHSQRTRMDIEYAAFFSFSLFAFYGGMKNSRFRPFFFALFWLCTGLGFMTKGPVVFLNLAVVLPYWVIAQKKGFFRVSPKLFCAAFPAALVPTLPWVYKMLAHPDFSRYIGSLAGASIMRRHEGIFYYILELFQNFSPALFFLPICFVALKKEMPADRNTASLVWFLMVWFGTVFMLLHIPPAKVNRYLIPIFPPLAILIAMGITAALRNGLFTRYLQRTSSCISLAAAAFFLTAPAVIWGIYGFRGWFFVLSALMLLVVRAEWKRGPQNVFVLFFCLPMVFLYVELFSSLRNDKTSEVKTAYETIVSRGIQADQVFLLDAGDHERITFGMYFNRLVAAGNSSDKMQDFPCVITREAIETPDGYRNITPDAAGRSKKDFRIFIRKTGLENSLAEN